MRFKITHLVKTSALIISVATSCCIWAQTAIVSDSTSKVPATGVPTQPVNASVSKPHDDSFVIGANDVLAISVWKEPDISRSVPVRSDGKISLPLAGEMQAAGVTPLKLEHDITNKLKSYIADPEVTIVVQQINSQKYNILGYIARPGSYSLNGSSTILDAIAIAGGFRDFAK